MKKIEFTKQSDIVLHVLDTARGFSDQLTHYKTRMERIYKNISKFEGITNKPGEAVFKVNKAHEIENKILPRILARDPKWIVSYKKPDGLDNEDTKKRADAIRDYLEHTFKKQDLKEVMRLWAKSMIRYGQGRTKVGYKYEISRYSKKEMVEDVTEDGDLFEYQSTTYKEEVNEEYPCIEHKSWTDVLFDPRYVRLEDMPAIIETARNVRLSFFTKHPKKYLNVDKLVACAKAGLANDPEGYKQTVLQKTGINISTQKIIRPDTLDITKYYGRYDMSDNEDLKDEKLYEFWTINDTILVYAEEISCIPFEDVRCFEDTETYLSVGFVEPILGLQDELNFKKNSASTYINQSLYRQWIRSPNSGVDPRKLVNAGPGAIIPTSKDVQTAQANLVEVPHRTIPADYFQEQNDFERQIQGLTFTVDTAQPLGQQSLTNTATGAKIKAFESNAVINEVRKHFEEGLERLAYKFLQYTFDNLDNNITIKKSDGNGFREINREVMKKAVERYDIKVESGSSSFDSEETRREVSIAKWNLGIQAKQLGLPINLKELFTDVLQTFEGTDIEKLFEAQMPQMLTNVPSVGTLPQGEQKVQPVEQMDPANISQLQ